MKVLQINSVCGVGSTGKIAADLYRVLKDQGHECKIAYGRGTAPGDLDTIKIGSNLDNYVHGIKTRLFDQHGFGSANATRELIKQIEQYAPDIIHLHNLHGYYINIEMLFHYLKSVGKPVVWTLHDCWPFTGHCSHFDYIGCDRWKTGCFACPQKKEYPASFLSDRSKNTYEKKKELFTSVKNMTIVTPSNWLANLVKQSFLGKYPVKVVPNGIDLDVFQPTSGRFRDQYHLHHRKIILGVANIWNFRKGLKYFLQLADKLDDSYQIVLVGVTERQKQQLPANVLGITKTNNVKQLAELYTAAAVFINPTLEDNFPTTNLEALACGTPVITFNTGGSPESIDETCGVVVKKGNMDACQAAIKSLLTDKKAIQGACIARAKLYEKYYRFDGYVRLYRELC